MTTFLLLIHRLVLFAVFQALIALGYRLNGSPQPWEASIAWWPLTAALAGLVSLAWQGMLLRMDGRSWREYIAAGGQDRAVARKDRSGIARNALLALGAALVGMPLAYLPNVLLGGVLFGDAQATLGMMFRPLPGWAAALQLIAFPLFIALSELPAYFAFATPRLRPQLGRTGAWVAAALFLALQHTTLPLIFDGSFILWRALMFIPFALWTGWVLYRRPRLLPYMMVVHFLMDLLTALMVYQAG